MGEWIAIGGLAVTLLGVFASFISKNSENNLTIKNLQKNLEKLEKKNNEEHTELYKSRNETNLNLQDLTTTIRMLVTQNEKSFDEIKTKLDKLSEARGK